MAILSSLGWDSSMASGGKRGKTVKNSLSRVHLPQYDEIYGKVHRRVGRLLSSRRNNPRGYRTLALDILDTAKNIIVDKLEAYRRFYESVNDNAGIKTYVREVHGEAGLQALKEAAYLDSHIIMLWKTLRKHLIYMPLDGIVNESLNYVARLLSVIKRKKKVLERVLEIKKDLAKAPIIKEGNIVLVIAGPPNSGKSTLIKQIAGIDSEIAEYPLQQNGFKRQKEV